MDGGAMRIFGLLILSVLLSGFVAGCQRPPAEEAIAAETPTENESPAQPSKSTDLDWLDVSPEVRSRYADYLAAANVEVEQDFELFNRVMRSESGESHFETAECSPQSLSSRDVREGNPPDWATVVLVRTVASYSESFERAGYPHEIYRNSLQRYQQALLSSARLDPDTQELILDLDAEGSPWGNLEGQLEKNRAAISPSSPPLKGTFECGPEQVSARFTTDPSGGRVWVTDKFSFEYCRRTTSDPFDVGKCRRWVETTNSSLDVFGNYVAHGRWNGGGFGWTDLRILKGSGEFNEAEYVIRPTLR